MVSDLPLTEIKHAFAADFEHYPGTEQHAGSNTAMKHPDCLHTILHIGHHASMSVTILPSTSLLFLSQPTGNGVKSYIIKNINCREYKNIRSE
jgi:hypothetical protein